MTARAYSEEWIAKKLGLLPGWVDASTAQRREHIRAEILQRGAAETVVHRAGKFQPAITFRMAFQRCFDQPLQTDEMDFTFTADEGA